MNHNSTRSIVSVLLAGLWLGAPDVSAEFNLFNPTAGEFEQYAQNALDESQKLLDKVLAVQGERDVENTLAVANQMYIHLMNAFEISGLYAQTHPDAAVRDVADVAEQKISKFLTNLGLNRKLYEAYKAVDISKADSEVQRLVFKSLRDFKRSGVDRDPETRERIRTLQDELVKLSQQFSNNIRDDLRSIQLDSPAELAGLPNDYIEEHAPGEDGKITITTDYPDYIPFMKYAENADARLRMYKKYRRRGYPQNLEILDDVLARRYELAKLLGFDNYADYITGDKMIKKGAAVKQFIHRIADAAKSRAAEDMALLLEEKQKFDPVATKVSDYERSFLAERVKSTKFNFDSQEARPYFEFNRVQQGLFDVTGKLFGVQYRPVKGLKLWHQDVTAWDIYDGSTHIGRFMLDLHPREGKYKHAACFGFHTGIEGKQIPISVLVCNFPNPRTSSGPALMEHAQVDTFFHEFGHLLHALFSGHHKWITISGISTEWDFVEAPSQMLEEWVWDVDTLQMFAKHHETGEPIPAELVRRMRTARDFGKGTYVRQQMFYAAVSLNLHNRNPKLFDTSEMVRKLTAKFAPCDYVDDTYMHCSFGHLMGYSAIYYTYMWSLVIAKDLFSEFEEASLFDSDVAKRYRHHVLEPGGAREAAQLVKEFLGRDYNFNAYERWLTQKTTGSP